MITAEEVTRSIYGAWRLARLDANGMRSFDGTEGAFWRSFFAAVLLLPAYVLLNSIGETGLPSEAGLGRLFAVEAIAYVIGWTAFPLAAFYAVALMDRGERYFAYITAYNWAQIIEMGLFLIVALAGVSLGADGPSLTLRYLAFGAVLVYEWFIARTALNISTALAVGPVVLGLIITIFLQTIARGLLHVPA